MRTPHDHDASSSESPGMVSRAAFDTLCAGTSFLAGLASVGGREATARQLFQDLVAIEVARGKALAGDEDLDDEDDDDDDDDDALPAVTPRSRRALA